MTPHEECPYGASDCPKIESLRRMIEQNGKELEQVNKNVVELTTTIRNTTFFILIVATLLAGILGVVFV
jgi:hypothetical protein